MVPPRHEPFRTTLARTGTIAVVVGVGVSVLSGGGPRRWPIATLLALWATLGGHYVELLYLRVVRPRLPAERAVQRMARLVVWFAGGCALATAMYATAVALSGAPPRWPWWVGGVAFVALELVVHLVLHLRGHGSDFDGRG
jgi:hypothetical protein